MTWHGRACGTHLRRKSDLGSPAAKTGLTHWTNSSTVRRPRSSNRTTKSPGDSNSKGKQGSLRKAAMRNVIFDHPSPNLWKALPGNSNNTGNSKLGKSNKPSGGSRANLSAAAWLSKEVYESRKANRQCTRCSSGDHKTYLCTKYGKSNPPEQNSTNNSGYDGKEIKRQKSSDTRQQKNLSTSHDI